MSKQTPRQKYTLAYRNLIKETRRLKTLRKQHAEFDCAEDCFSITRDYKGLDYSSYLETLGEDVRSHYGNLGWEMRRSAERCGHLKEVFDRAETRLSQFYWSRKKYMGDVSFRYGFFGRLPTKKNDWDALIVGSDYEEIYRIQFASHFCPITFHQKIEIIDLGSAKDILTKIAKAYYKHRKNWGDSVWIRKHDLIVNYLQPAPGNARYDFPNYVNNTMSYDPDTNMFHTNPSSRFVYRDRDRYRLSLCDELYPEQHKISMTLMDSQKQRYAVYHRDCGLWQTVEPDRADEFVGRFHVQVQESESTYRTSYFMVSADSPASFYDKLVTRVNNMHYGATAIDQATYQGE